MITNAPIRTSYIAITNLKHIKFFIKIIKQTTLLDNTWQA